MKDTIRRFVVPESPVGSLHEDHDGHAGAAGTMLAMIQKKPCPSGRVSRDDQGVRHLGTGGAAGRRLPDQLI